jgi:hypothetical protein
VGFQRSLGKGNASSTLAALQANRSSRSWLPDSLSLPAGTWRFGQVARGDGSNRVFSPPDPRVPSRTCFSRPDSQHDVAVRSCRDVYCAPFSVAWIKLSTSEWNCFSTSSFT